MEFTYQGFQFKPLEACDLTQIVNDLNHSDFIKAATLKYPGLSLKDVLNQRHQASLDGRHLNLFIFKHNVCCGWVGLVPCPSDTSVRETSVYLHPTYWGSGLNFICQSLLWDIGCKILNYPFLVISINEINMRSIKGHKKLFADSPVEILDEPSKNRISVNIKLDRPPIGYKITDDSKLQEIDLVIKNLKGYQKFKTTR